MNICDYKITMVIFFFQIAGLNWKKKIVEEMCDLLADKSWTEGEVNIFS